MLIYNNMQQHIKIFYFGENEYIKKMINYMFK